MKKIIKIAGVILILILAALGVTLLVGGRDVPPPDTAGLSPTLQTVPKDQNAYPQLMAAAESLVLPPDLNELLAYVEGKPANKSQVTTLLEKNPSVFGLIDKALAFDRFQAPEDENMAYIDKWYQLAIVLAVHSTHEREADRFSQSILPCIALMRMGNMIHPNAQNLAEYNAGISILQLGLDQVKVIVHSKKVSQENLGVLETAMAVLKPLDQGLVQALQFKFASVAESVDTFRSKKINLEEAFNDVAGLPFLIRKTKWFPKYMFKENETKQTAAKLYRDMIQNAKSYYGDMNMYNLEEYLGLVNNRFLFVARPNFVGRVFFAFTTPDFASFFQTKCQIEGTVRAMRILTALKSYQIKNNGKLPESLAALSPEYLKEIPLDPFNGKPFIYSREKEIFYSVGKDGKDSGGSVKIPEGEIYGEDYPKTWIAEDAVFKINQSK